MALFFDGVVAVVVFPPPWPLVVVAPVVVAFFSSAPVFPGGGDFFDGEGLSSCGSGKEMHAALERKWSSSSLLLLLLLTSATSVNLAAAAVKAFRGNRTCPLVIPLSFCKGLTGVAAVVFLHLLGFFPAAGLFLFLEDI